MCETSETEHANMVTEKPASPLSLSALSGGLLSKITNNRVSVNELVSWMIKR